MMLTPRANKMTHEITSWKWKLSLYQGTIVYEI